MIDCLRELNTTDVPFIDDTGIVTVADERNLVFSSQGFINTCR
jgi:hypothetical protein